MNDETKQDQQQQQDAVQEVGGAGAGESVIGADAGQILSGTSTSSIPNAESKLDGESQTGLGSSNSATRSKESSSEATSLQSLSGVSPGDYANGLQCSWHGKATADMSRDELIAFIGMLDDYATRLANAAQGVGTDSQTEQLTAAHPIHTVLAELESEIERPGAILKARVKSLINDARALF